MYEFDENTQNLYCHAVVTYVCMYVYYEFCIRYHVIIGKYIDRCYLASQACILMKHYQPLIQKCNCNSDDGVASDKLNRFCYSNLIVAKYIGACLLCFLNSHYTIPLGTYKEAMLVEQGVANILNWLNAEKS